MTISPPAGPCDATVEIELAGFEPNKVVRLDIARPSSDDILGSLPAATTNSAGAFSGARSLGQSGCAAAALSDNNPGTRVRAVIGIFAGFDPERMHVDTRTEYHYTTTVPSSATTVPSTTPSRVATAQATGPSVSGGSSHNGRWALAAVVIVGGFVVAGIGSWVLRRARR